MDYISPFLAQYYAFQVERAWRKSPVRAQLQSDLIQCRRLVREFKSDAGWGICNDSGSTRTLYRRELRHDTHSFKVTGIAECALMDLFAVIYEADLYAEWFPFMKVRRPWHNCEPKDAPLKHKYMCL